MVARKENGSLYSVVSNVSLDIYNDLPIVTPDALFYCKWYPNVTIYKRNSNNTFEVFQLIRKICRNCITFSNGSILLQSLTAFETYTYNATSQAFEMASFWTPNPIAQPYTLVTATANGSVFLGSDYSSLMLVILCFGSGFIELPPFPDVTYFYDYLLNVDGSAFTIVFEDSTAPKEYYKAIDNRAGSSSTTPPAVANCEWYYTAYVCNCSNDPNSNSTGMNTTCSCYNGSTWENYQCTLNCSAFAHTNGTNDASSCSCVSGWKWANSSVGCAIDCTADPHAASAVSAQ